jgi:hypothetical protein
MQMGGSDGGSMQNDGMKGGSKQNEGMKGGSKRNDDMKSGSMHGKGGPLQDSGMRDDGMQPGR